MPRSFSSHPGSGPSHGRLISIGSLCTLILTLALGLTVTHPFAAEAGPPATLPNGRVLLEGVVRTWHGDTPEGASIDHGAGLDVGDQVIPLRIDDDRAHGLAGKRVRVGGVVANGQLTPDTGGTTVLAAEVAAATSKNVAVILMHFNNRVFNSEKVSASQPVPPPPPAPGDVANFMFNNTDSVRAHFEQSSDGLATITGDVLGWYTIPYGFDSTDTNGDGTFECAYSTWGNAGRAAAQAAGVNLSGYQYFVYVFPTAPLCGWAGLGQLPGSSSWSNGYVNHQVFVHELGHNWGVHHASSYTCNADTDGDPLTAKVRVPIAATASDCTSSEYGDPFGVMGSWNYKLHNNFHRAQLGWLPDQQSVTTTGVYQLAGVNGAAGVAPRLLSIPRPGGTYLALELRQAEAPFDVFSASANPASGVSVRITPSLSTRSQSRLVDTTPATTTFSDAALPVGASLFDPASGATITAQSVAGSVATVSISFAADTTPPSSPTNLTATAVNWSTIQLAWTASTDNAAVTGYRVKRDGIVIGTTASTSFTDGGRTANTTYTYEVSAFDAAPNYSAPAGASATTPQNVTLSMRVSSVQVSVATGKNRRDVVTATATLVNSAGVPVGSATVAGTFKKAGTTFSSKSGLTSASGLVTLKSDQTSAASSGTVYQFCVTGATLTGYALDTTASTLCGQVTKP